MSLIIADPRDKGAGLLSRAGKINKPGKGKSGSGGGSGSSFVYPAAYMLMTAYEGNNTSNLYYDRTNSTASPSWYARHQAIPVTEYIYYYSNTAHSSPGFTAPWKVFTGFALTNTHYISSTKGSGVSSACTFDIEFLKVDGTSVFGLSVWPVDLLTTGVNYDVSAPGALGGTSAGTSVQGIGGTFTYNATTLIFTNTAGAGYIPSFNYSCNMAAVTKVRVRVLSMYCTNTSAAYAAFGTIQKLS